MVAVSQRFAEMVSGPEADICLDEAALLIAAHAHPGLDVGRQLGRLDDLASACPSADLAGLRHHLFGTLGFTGNIARYDDPRNSFLDDVLDRRCGIPISLAVLTIEVGRRLGVPLVGVGLPGHFLVGHLHEQPAVFVDAFAAGRVLDRDGCSALFASLFGSAAGFDDALLKPVGARAILVRMLANLRSIYLAAGDARSLGWVMRLRALIPAASVAELADRASAQAGLARFTEAASTLEAMADMLPPERAARVRATARLLRARLN